MFFHTNNGSLHGYLMVLFHISRLAGPRATLLQGAP